MTYIEFMNKVLTAFPNGVVGTDNDGQLVVYTNFKQGEGAAVVEFDDPNLTGV